MSEKPDSSGTVGDEAQRLLGIIYETSPATSSSAGFPGPSSFAPSISVKRLSPTLNALLDILVDSSQPDHSGSRLSGTSQRMRIADHICTLLSRTVRGFDEQQAIAVGGRGKETLAALRRLVEFGSEKVSFLLSLVAGVRN